MALTPGSRIGPYEIVSAIGAGGMGEVFCARDSKLGRDVAIKVLPDVFATDADRLKRFEREAQVLASLNHPHIAQVYGVLENPVALIMELVPGEDLAQRIARGPLPVREALEIAVQIADAIESAHQKNIIHRDLKPANVKVTEEGVVKVLDFGLAKALDVGAGSALSHDLLNSPTITSPAAMTAMGVIIGTASYMAPEQAKGKAADRSADLWALGALLYEMLTGRRAFDGETVTDVLAAVVMRDPDWTALPAETPPSIGRLLRRCMERDRRRRLSDAGEARFQIEEALAEFGVAPAAAARPDRPAALPRTNVWMIVALLSLTALAGFVASKFWTESDPGVSRFHIELPPKTVLALAIRPSMALSRDGRTVVFAAARDGLDRLYVRNIDSFEVKELAGTEGGSNPMISPDGKWVAFLTASALSKLPLSGGPVTKLADVSDPRGGRWDSDEWIYYTPQSTGGIFRVSTAGGAPEQLTELKSSQERTHRWPQLLPGGKAIIFTVGSFLSPDNYDDAVVEAMTLSTRERRVLVRGAAVARFVATGHLLFLRAGTLFAVRFEPDTLEVQGAPVAVLPGVGADTTTGAAHFDVSASGSLAFFGSAAGTDSLRPMWVDRAGRTTPLTLPAGSYADPALSPDGANLAIVLIAGGGRDVWVHNFERKTSTRLTFAGQNMTPLWSRDGTMIYYSQLDPRQTQSGIYRRAADGSGDAELLARVDGRIYLGALTPDEKGVIFDSVSTLSTKVDLMSIEFKPGATPTVLIKTPYVESTARLSSDGRWMAYVSGEESRLEIFVRPYGGVSRRWQVSTATGEEPKWGKDGKTLYYRSGTTLMAARVDSSSTFDTAAPEQLFAGLFNLRTESGISYDVDPEGRRFLMVRVNDEHGGPDSIRMVVNWTTELRRIVAGR